MKTTQSLIFAALLAFSFVSCRGTRTLTDAHNVVDPATIYKEVPAAGAAPVTNTTVYSSSAAAQTTTTTVASTPASQPSSPVLQPGDRTEVVKVVNGADAALLKNYNVVVGSFGNPTNAQNYLNTMKGRGYPSFLVQNASGLYRVVAASFDTREAAIASRDEIRTRFTTDDNGLCPSAWLLVPTR